jgi:diguanylate cyclase (GGDEF)-like protein
MRAPLRVLHIGEPDQARQVAVLLRAARGTRGVPALRLAHAGSLPVARRWLRGGGADCLLVTAAAVAEAGAAAPELPIVALATAGGEGAALRAVRAGAEECVELDLVDAPTLARVLRFAVERHRSRSELLRLALYDSLTGLANRALLHDRLGHALAHARRHEQSVAVIFLDLDGFKAINDSFGHHAGDAVLVEIGRRLTAALRPSDTVARYGGDEFAVLCEDANAVGDVLAVEQRVVVHLEPPIHLAAARLQVTTSMGHALSRPTDAPEDLVRRADAAMYAAKRARAPSRHDVLPIR